MPTQQCLARSASVARQDKAIQWLLRALVCHTTREARVRNDVHYGCRPRAGMTGYVHRLARAGEGKAFYFDQTAVRLRNPGVVSNLTIKFACVIILCY
jgi:hypothetical protein